MTLHWRAGTLVDGDPVVLTPEQAGWAYCGLRVVRLEPAATRAFNTGPDEMAVLPLSGSLVVEVDGGRFLLGGRDDVFSRVTDWAYVPRDADVRLSAAAGAEFAQPLHRFVDAAAMVVLWARKRLSLHFEPRNQGHVTLPGLSERCRAGDDGSAQF